MSTGPRLSWACHRQKHVNRTKIVLGLSQTETCQQDQDRPGPVTDRNMSTGPRSSWACHRQKHVNRTKIVLGLSQIKTCQQDQDRSGPVTDKNMSTGPRSSWACHRQKHVNRTKIVLGLSQTECRYDAMATCDEEMGNLQNIENIISVQVSKLYHYK